VRGVGCEAAQVYAPARPRLRVLRKWEVSPELSLLLERRGEYVSVRAVARRGRGWEVIYVWAGREYSWSVYYELRDACLAWAPLGPEEHERLHAALEELDRSLRRLLAPPAQRG
jgi:hypothetical protein